METMELQIINRKGLQNLSLRSLPLPTRLHLEGSHPFLSCECLNLVLNRKHQMKKTELSIGNR